MAALNDPLLHMTTLADWSEAARGETFGADLVARDGFLHMSTPEQITGPANALFAGQTDAWLLVVDAARLPVPVRWESGDPSADDGSLFPHLYAPLPSSAVIAAVPYAPGPDGMFHQPVDLPEPDDHLGRARALEWYLARARATRVGQLDAAFSVRHNEYAVSSQHNRLVLLGDPSPAEASLLCSVELEGLENWQVYIEGEMTPDAISAYELAGWTHTESLIMVASEAATRVAEPPVNVVEVDAPVDSAEAATWSDDIARVLDPELREIIEREAVTGGVARHAHLAILDDDGEPAMSADLNAAGATAQLDNVMARRDSRGQGLATAIILDAVERARRMGCDVLFLRTDAADWPHEAYERLGFQTIGTAHVFDRLVARSS